MKRIEKRVIVIYDENPVDNKTVGVGEVNGDTRHRLNRLICQFELDSERDEL